MQLLAADQKFRFIGYNVRYGSKANGTLASVPENQLIETPVAENLIVGIATGYALKGHPVMAYIERFDFVLNALDALVNHTSRIEALSRGQFKTNIILRTLVGNTQRPLFTGLTHTQDFSEGLNHLLGFREPVVKLVHPEMVFTEYERAAANLEHHSTVLIEYRDNYDTKCETTNTAISKS